MGVKRASTSNTPPAKLLLTGHQTQLQSDPTGEEDYHRSPALDK